jgi:subtilisin
MNMAKTPDSGSATPPDTSSSKAGSAPAQPKPEAARGAGASDLRPASAAPGDTPGASASAAGSSGTSSTPAPQGRKIGERKKQYMIAARPQMSSGLGGAIGGIMGVRAMSFQPLQFSAVEQALRSSPDIDVVDTVGPKNVVGALAAGMGESSGVLVAKMTEQKANVLHQQAQGQLLVERDQHLAMLDPTFPQPGLVAGLIPNTGPALTAEVLVCGKDNAPLADAEVYLFGSLLPARGTTDATGKVSLTLFGDTPQSIRGLYVKPKADYWSFYQRDPDISTDEANVVALRPLSDWPALPDFPRQQSYGWGQRAMRLDKLPPNYRGQGIKIAVIDSGAATTHGDLGNIRFGFDIVNKKTNPNTWNDDSVGHGSHCAGVIAGADNALGLRGFAPDAEVHACKLFPGGQISQLIDALEYCIEKQIDVVNLSLGGAEPSEALEQQILRAKRAGIACIVAAGNSGGPVQYPASSPNVLAVSAIGKLNEFPPDSYHSETLTQFMDASGYYSAKFTCYGPQVAVCAPGVAITSSVPANNYAVWDGTSMAAPHITGLAALVLAHHPDFQTAFAARGAARVERLFQIIKSSARPINLGDPARTGFGLPDAPTAVGLQQQAARTAGSIGNIAPFSTQQNTLDTLMSIPGVAQSILAHAGHGQQLGSAIGGFVGSGLGQQFNPQMAQPWSGNPWGQAGYPTPDQIMRMQSAFGQGYGGYVPFMQ